MGWKIYFWFYVVLSILGLLALIGQINSLSFWIDIVLSVLSLVGLYSYAFYKKLLSPQIWMVVFVLSLLSLLAAILQGVFNISIPVITRSGGGISGIGAIVTVLLTLPAYYALYELANNRFAGRKNNE